MIKGGGYIGARTRQPPTVQTHYKQKKNLVWVRGVVCRGTQTHTMIVVAEVALLCICCFNNRCMSDGRRNVRQRYQWPLPGLLAQLLRK